MSDAQVSTKLAKTFAELGGLESRFETTAASVLRIIRDQDVRTLDVWDTAVRAAFKLNGWHERRGHPSAKETARRRVPGTVRQYVYLVRAAFRAKLQVWQFGSFYELRQALLKARVARRRSRPARPALPELEGVNLARSATRTGALFHDLAVTFVGLTRTMRLQMVRDLARLLSRYSAQLKVVKEPLAA